MNTLLNFLCVSMTLCLFMACTPKQEQKTNLDGLVFVQGGTMKNQKSRWFGSEIQFPSFYIGKYEVTQKEWIDVMGSNPSKSKGDKRPVENMNWYKSLEYCNARSLKERLEPYYNINKEQLDPENISEYDHIKWTVSINTKANGYRLPTDLEFTYAASGGQESKNYSFSGSDFIDQVAWYWRNSGDEPVGGNWNYAAVEANHNCTHDVGSKEPNELGLFDMSGNVYEFCYDWYIEDGAEKGLYRVIRGGSWQAVGETCKLSFIHNITPNNKGQDVGLRVCRNE